MRRHDGDLRLVDWFCGAGGSPRIGSLFSGYGGLDMGVQAAIGGTTAWVSDIDPGACKILAHRWPDVPNLGDVTAVDWAQVEPVDVLTGVPGLTRADQLKALGNGVVPQQAEAAIRDAIGGAW